MCSLRIASNTRRKNQTSGDWEDKPNFFDVTVWGAQGENCARFLAKGRPVAIDGRLEWREWQDKEGNNRQNVEIVADSVQFLGSRDDAGTGGGGGNGFTPRSDVPADTRDFEPAGTPSGKQRALRGRRRHPVLEHTACGASTRGRRARSATLSGWSPLRPCARRASDFR